MYIVQHIVHPLSTLTVKLTTDIGELTTEMSKYVTEMGEPATERGELVTEIGELTTEMGELATEIGALMHGNGTRFMVEITLVGQAFETIFHNDKFHGKACIECVCLLSGFDGKCL